MLIYFSEELKSAYTIKDGELLQAHIKDGITDTDTFDYIDFELIGDEVVPFEGTDRTFNEIWSEIKNRLQHILP
jgi:hypothetical protein